MKRWVYCDNERAVICEQHFKTEDIVKSPGKSLGGRVRPKWSEVQLNCLLRPSRATRTDRLTVNGQTFETDANSDIQISSLYICSLCSGWSSSYSLPPLTKGFRKSSQPFEQHRKRLPLLSEKGPVHGLGNSIFDEDFCFWRSTSTCNLRKPILHKKSKYFQMFSQRRMMKCSPPLLILPRNLQVYSASLALVQAEAPATRISSGIWGIRKSSIHTRLL